MKYRFGLSEIKKGGNMTTFSRRDWGARQAKDKTPLPVSMVDALVIHYTAAMADEFPEGRDYTSRVRGIQNFHMNTNGWSDIAYNWLVARDGTKYEGRGWRVQSAATLNHNEHTQAIVFMGADKAGRDDVTDKGRKAISELIFQYENISGRKVHPRFVHKQHGNALWLALGGHKDFVSTECPGAELYHFITLQGWNAYRAKAAYPPKFFHWAAWYLGEGDYAKYGPRARGRRPKIGRTAVLPISYWVALRRFLAARNKR